MPTLRYAKGAVADLESWLETNLPGFVTTIAGEEAILLAAVDAFRRGVHPYALDAIAVEVECTAWREIDAHNDIWEFDCPVHVVYRAPDADLLTAQEIVRSYVSAVVRCIRSDYSLGNKVIQADITGGEFSGVSQDGQAVVSGTTHVSIERQEV